MASVPEGDVLGTSADHLVLGRLRVVLAHIRPPPGIEHVRVRVDLLVVVDRVHRDRDLRTLRDECAIREGVILHRGAPQRLCEKPRMSANGREASERGDVLVPRAQ